MDLIHPDFYEKIEINKYGGDPKEIEGVGFPRINIVLNLFGQIHHEGSEKQNVY